MEKLNLSSGKVKVFKLKTFIILLIISALPTIAMIYLSYQIRYIWVGNLISKYPAVFNNLTNFNLSSIENQIDNLIVSFKNRAQTIKFANEETKKQIIKSYKSSYFLKYFAKRFENNPNKVFVKEILYDGVRIYIDFYEYGLETKLDTSTIYSDLAKFYENVNVELKEEQNFFSNTKYFHYTVEAIKQ